MFDMTFAVIGNEEQRSELADFYLKNKQRLYTAALSKLHNAVDAEDAVQEVFSRIADKPEKFFEIPAEGRLAYAVIMVKNISIDMFNAKNKVPIEQLDEEIEDIMLSLEDTLFDNISCDEVMSFVNKLPTMQRNVLMLRCFFDLSIDETAQRLHIALDSANKNLTLARRAIRRFIDERNIGV